MITLALAVGYAVGVIVAYHLGRETGRCCPDSTCHDERRGA